MEYGPGTAYEFPYLANWGSLNNNRTTGYMAWDAMGLEEVQNQLNDAEKYDISAIDILLRFWKSASGELMVKVTGLHGLGGEAVEADDVNIEYPDTLTL